MKILLIEDEEKLAKYLKRSLQEEGIILEYCTNGKDGQVFIELNHKDLDLIIADRLLPDMDGAILCKSIRLQNISTPILILSAKNTVNDRVFGLNAGADDYLTKPFSLSELLARIRALTRRPKQTLAPKVLIGEITLDTNSKILMVKNKKINLTLKEFRLLEYFIKHPNQVITRENIIDQLWDINFDPASNVIDVHIKNLRKKINDEQNQRLETVRGVGYKWNSNQSSQS